MTQASNPVGLYLGKIQQELSTGHAQEHSYRPALKELFETVTGLRVVNEPKGSAHGRPDFIFVRGDVPIAWAEAKDLHVSLEKIEKSEQMERYFGYPTLILTNGLEFRFYQNGQRYGDAFVLAEKDGSTVISKPEVFDAFVRTLADFMTGEIDTIRSAEHLAKIMGGKAKRLRDNIVAMFDPSFTGSRGEIEKIMQVLKQRLLHDLSIDQFADLYAQTLVYGLFVARYHDESPESFSRTEARERIPASNHLLQQFFDHIAGANFEKRLSFIVDELCDVFIHADVHALVLIANLLPFIPGKAIPIIGYPATWESLSLLLVTAFLVTFILMSFQIEWFIPKLTEKNLDLFAKILWVALYSDKTPESLAAAARILEGPETKNGHPRNLEALIKLASKSLREERRRHQARQIIDQILSDRDYAQYLATKNFYQTYNWYALATKYEIWKHRMCFFFFQSLTGALYREKDSWLGREEEYTGMGVGKSLNYEMFGTLNSLGSFQLFGNFLATEDKEDYRVQRRYLNGLTISLKEYYENPEHQLKGDPAFFVGGAFDFARSVDWYKLPADRNEIWEHPIRKSVDLVEHFYRDLQNIVEDSEICLEFTAFEQNVEDGSVAEAIVNGMFQFLEQLAAIKNVDFARTASCSLFWVLMDSSSRRLTPMVETMEKQLLALIQERVKDNLEGAFHSMIPLLLDIYGFKFNSGGADLFPIGKFIHEQFLKVIAPKCLQDSEFAKDHLPSTWHVRDGAIFRESFMSKDEQMFPAVSGKSDPKPAIVEAFENKTGEEVV